MTAWTRLLMTLWLFDVMPDDAPGSDDVDDHPRAGVRLARSGRSLDGQRRTVELQRQPARGLRSRFAGLDQRAA